MRETSKTITVEGLQIKLYDMGIDGLDVIDKMRGMFGGLFSAMGAIGKGEDEQLEALGKAFNEAMKGLSSGELKELINMLIASGYVVIEGEKILHLNDLDKFADRVSPLYLSIVLAKEMFRFSIAPALGKLGKSLNFS